MLNEQLPAILDSFTGIANTTSTPIGVGGGWWEATKWWAKATLTLKTAKWYPLVPFLPPHIKQSS